MGGMVAIEMAARYPERVQSLCLLNTRSEFVLEVDDLKRLAEDFAVHLKGYPDRNTFQYKHIHAPQIVLHRETSKEQLDLSTFLPKIQTSTLVVGGEFDALCPPDVCKGLARDIPTATYQEVPQAGHFLPLFQADLLNSLLLNHWTEQSRD